jgi:diguanylate cyclase (GGDEF)-like protein/PAS domain S-box-containing protein
MRQFELMFNALLEMSPMGVGFARDGVTVDANQVYLDIFGYDDLNEIRNSPLLNMIAPQCRSEMANRVSRRAEGGAVDSTYQTLGLRKDGSIFPLLISAKRIETSGGPLTLAFFVDLSEQIRNEVKYRTLFDTTRDAVMLLDENGFFDCNPATLEIFGCNSRDCFISKHPADLSPPQQPCGTNSKSLAKQYIAKAFETGSLHFDWVHRRADTGADFPAEVLLSYMELDGKKVLQASVRDISQRKQIESKLEKSAEKLRTLFEMSPVGIARNAMDGTFVEANQAFLKIVGYTIEELNRLSYWDLTPVSYTEQEAKQLESLRSRAQYDHYEKEYINSHGQLVPVCLNGVQIAGEDGKKYIWSIVEDISVRKRTDRELRIAATAFEADVGIIVTDANSIILKVNRAFSQQSGYSAEEAIGQTPRLFQSGRHGRDFYSAMWESINFTGSWQGEIWDRRKSGEVYPKWLTISAIKDETGAVTHYVGTQTDISDRKEWESTIQNLAFYDPLTQLPNRRLLQDRLHHAFTSSERSGNYGALLFIDLDNFKEINDAFGHGTGDLLLQQVAQRLAAAVREGDTVARMGGDEFVVMLEELSDEELDAASQIEVVGEKILDTLNRPYHLGNHELFNSPSIGVALFKGNQQSLDELFKQADIAMYQAKRAGRNTIRFFDPQMQDSINARTALESELRNAIKRQQLRLFYQIQVDSSKRAIGAEALIRWIHPERGMVSPAQFIPLAEEGGLIIPIGKWVIETACAQLQQWQQNEQTRNLVLSVNVSAKQFRQADFMAHVTDTIQYYGISPNLLKIELTEGMLLDKVEETITIMNELKEIGISLSLDDFGTGYSSLQYLKRLPLNQLKIDQSFVRDIETDSNDQAIVRTIIAMAHSLNLDVIAEGVETEQQRQFLLDSGCSHYQGYLFSKPVPIDQFVAYLMKN